MNCRNLSKFAGDNGIHQSPWLQKRKEMKNLMDVSNIKMARFGYMVDMVVIHRHVRVKMIIYL